MIRLGKLIGWIATILLVIEYYSLLANEYGILGIVIGTITFPITLVVSIFYQGFMYGDWSILLIIIFGTILHNVFVNIGLRFQSKQVYIPK